MLRSVGVSFLEKRKPNVQKKIFRWVFFPRCIDIRVADGKGRILNEAFDFGKVTGMPPRRSNEK